MIKQVEKIRLEDGSIYSGDLDEFTECPHGFGSCTYPDGHRAYGTFIGIPNGAAYINYDYYMQLGYFTQGLLQGWGMQMGNGDYRFGIYHRGQLIKDCTSLIEETHMQISHLSQRLRANGINVRWAHVFKKSHEVYFGVFEKGYKRIGIHFMPSGDVYIGVSPYSMDITGTFTHLKDSVMETGLFERGALVKQSMILEHTNYWTEIPLIDEISFDWKDEQAFEISRLTRDLF